MVVLAMAWMATAEAGTDPDLEAVSVELITDPCVQAADRAGGVTRSRCRGADSAVVRSVYWNGPFAGVFEGRVDTTGSRSALALSGGFGHDFSRIHLAVGPSLQFMFTDRGRFAPGARARATLHPKRDWQTLKDDSEWFSEVRNSELVIEVRGAFWLGLPDAGFTPSAMLVQTMGSDNLRYGFTSELPLRRPTRDGGLPIPSGPLVGFHIEFRPEPRSS